MNLDRLRTFRALSELLHFRGTAKKLHLSQSAVSQQISALEDELGVLLVERMGRRVFLTPAGAVLVEEATHILAAVDRAIEAVRICGRGEAGRLRLGASTTPGVYIMPQALGALRKALPRVEITFRIDNSVAIERALIENELDLGVVGEDITQNELFQVAVAEDEIIGVAARSMLGTRRARHRVRAAELSRLPILAREAGSATQRHVDGAFARLGIPTSVAFALPSPEAQVRAAAAGLGVAFVSRHVAASDLAAGRLVEVIVDGLRLRRPIAAAYHRDKRITPAMQKLIALTKQHARSTKRR